jgi:hypothetical protein
MICVKREQSYISPESLAFGMQWVHWLCILLLMLCLLIVLDQESRVDANQDIYLCKKGALAYSRKNKFRNHCQHPRVGNRLSSFFGCFDSFTLPEDVLAFCSVCLLFNSSFLVSSPFYFLFASFRQTPQRPKR